MKSINISLGRDLIASADYSAGAEDGGLETTAGVSGGPSITVSGSGAPSVAGSVSVEGRVGWVFDHKISVTQSAVRAPTVDELFGDVLHGVVPKLDLGERKLEYRAYSAGATVKAEGEFGEANRFNLHPGLYLQQTNAVLKNRGRRIDGMAWELSSAIGPSFRSVASGSSKDESTLGGFLSIGGSLYLRKELDVAFTAGLTGTIYGDGVTTITPAVGLQGSF